MPIEGLLEHPKNPNKHTKEQIKRLAKILEYQGWTYPINVSNLSGFINTGHGRLAAAKLNGWTEVPVNFIDFESDEQELANLISDNAIAEWAELDLGQINLMLPEIGPIDIELLGIKDFEIEVADKYEAGCDEDEVPENVDTRAKPGDVWKLGEHRLVCGDSTNVQHVELLMNGEKADMVYTDPPYLPSKTRYGFDGFNGRKRESIKNCESDDQAIDCYNSIPSDVQELYVWGDYLSAQHLNFEIKDCIVWVKNNFGLGRGYRCQHEVCFYSGKFNESDSDVWNCPKDTGTVHPTQKPVALCERAIKNSKPKSVLDLFGGSGSTLIACEKTNRKCYMMELDPHYCSVILDRWEKYSKKTAELLNA